MAKKGKYEILLCQEGGKIRMFEYCQWYRFVCSTKSWITPVNSSCLGWKRVEAWFFHTPDYSSKWMNSPMPSLWRSVVEVMTRTGSILWLLFFSSFCSCSSSSSMSFSCLLYPPDSLSSQHPFNFMTAKLLHTHAHWHFVTVVVAVNILQIKVMFVFGTFLKWCMYIRE